MEDRIQRLEQRLRYTQAVLLILIAGIALTGATKVVVAASTKRGPLTVQAPFRVVDSAGRVCMEAGRTSADIPYVSVGASVDPAHLHPPLGLAGGDSPGFSLRHKDASITIGLAGNSADALFTDKSGSVQVNSAGASFTHNAPNGGMTLIHDGSINGFQFDKHGDPDSHWKMP